MIYLRYPSTQAKIDLGSQKITHPEISSIFPRFNPCCHDSLRGRNFGGGSLCQLVPSDGILKFHKPGKGRKGKSGSNSQWFRNGKGQVLRGGKAVQLIMVSVPLGLDAASYFNRRLIRTDEKREPGSCPEDIVRGFVGAGIKNVRIPRPFE